MLEFGNKEFRNLQEQVEKNKDDILKLRWGINIKYVASSSQDMANALSVAEDGDFILCKVAYASNPAGLWLHSKNAYGQVSNSYLGEFPAKGPKGEQGFKGDTGDTGATGNSIVACRSSLPDYTDVREGDYVLLFNGNLYQRIGSQFVLQTSLRGPQGPVGPEGGDEVSANPVGAYTDRLNKIEINGTIFNTSPVSEWENNIKDLITANGTTVEVGHDLEVDGDVKVNEFTDIVNSDNETLGDELDDKASLSGNNTFTGNNTFAGEITSNGLEVNGVSYLNYIYSKGDITKNIATRTAYDQSNHAITYGNNDDLSIIRGKNIYLSIDGGQFGVPATTSQLDTKADLVNGKVPASQLPSYVDDVEEYETMTQFPVTGESGKIYIAKDTNKVYRWSGSEYVEVSASLALGETSSTAYAGDKGKANADNITALQGRMTSAEGDIDTLEGTVAGHTTDINGIKAEYLKNASVADNTLTITKEDDTTVTFQGGGGDIPADPSVDGVYQLVDTVTTDSETSIQTAVKSWEALDLRVFNESDLKPWTPDTLAKANGGCFVRQSDGNGYLLWIKPFGNFYIGLKTSNTNWDCRIEQISIAKTGGNENVTSNISTAQLPQYASSAISTYQRYGKSFGFNKSGNMNYYYPVTNGYETLTLTESSGIYTSSQTFISTQYQNYDGCHVRVEVDTSATHSCVSFDLCVYDTVQCLSTGRITVGGQFYDVIAYLDTDGHVVIDLSAISGITSVKAHAITYAHN